MGPKEPVPGQGFANLVVAEIEAAGGRAVANADSVSEWVSTQRIVATALDYFGQLDLLVNNAGLSVSVPIWETEPDFFDRVVRSHVYGKGGVFGLTNVAARDLAPYGITVNGVNPAATETRQVSSAIEQLEQAGEAERRRAEGLRAALQPPEQAAALITALCHDDCARFNGQFFYIEKGRMGLFHPLEIQREATTSDPWTVDSLLEATGTLEPYSLGAVYGG